jgi:hypothetical protein
MTREQNAKKALPTNEVGTSLAKKATLGSYGELYYSLLFGLSESDNEPEG